VVRLFLVIGILAVSGVVFLGLSPSSSGETYADADNGLLPVETYPEKIRMDCRNGVAKVYDECSDQRPILARALRRANETGKSVLLVYGAEWCIWCHVFDKYINGQSRRFDYEWEYEGDTVEWQMRERANADAEEQARALNRYVAENFVIAHIEGHYSPNGLEVIEDIGFDTTKVTFLPFIFVMDGSGKYAGHMLAYDAIPGLEVRKDSGEDYRGFNRPILLRELKELRRQATQAG